MDAAQEMQRLAPAGLVVQQSAGLTPVAAGPQTQVTPMADSLRGV